MYILYIYAEKGKTLYHDYQSVQSFVCFHDVYGFSQQVSSLYKYYISTHCSFIIFFFLLQCFDRSTVIIVTMFCKQINERMQMNAHSGKAMNCNLSGFYWTCLMWVLFFFSMLSCSVDIKYIEKFTNSHRTKHFVLCVACLL